MAGKIENNKPVDPNARDVQIKTKLIALIGAVIILSSVVVATLSLTVFDRKQITATEKQLHHSGSGEILAAAWVHYGFHQRVTLPHSAAAIYAFHTPGHAGQALGAGAPVPLPCITSESGEKGRRPMAD